MSDDAVLVLRSLVVCGVSLAVVALLGAVVRRRASLPAFVARLVSRPVARRRRLELLERVAVAPGASLLLVRGDDATLVVALAGSNFVVLRELGDDRTPVGASRTDS